MLAAGLLYRGCVSPDLDEVGYTTYASYLFRKKLFPRALISRVLEFLWSGVCKKIRKNCRNFLSGLSLFWSAPAPPLCWPGRRGLLPASQLNRGTLPSRLNRATLPVSRLNRDTLPSRLHRVTLSHDLSRVGALWLGRSWGAPGVDFGQDFQELAKRVAGLGQ